MKKKLFIIVILSQLLLPGVCFSQNGTDLKRSKAVMLMNQGKYNEAISLLESIRSQSSSPDTLFMLGVLYQKSLRFRDSVETLKQYASLRPSDDEYHYYLGYAYYNLKEIEPALDEFNKSYIFGVKTDSASYYSGMIYFDRKDYTKALPFFVNASREGGEYENAAHYYAGVCLYKDGIGEGGPESLEASLYHFEKVLKDDSDISLDARRYINVIREFLDTGAIRQKKRLELKLRAELFYSTNRTSGEIEGIPALGYDADRSALGGDFMADISIAPLMYDTFGMFLSYGFSENLGFPTQVNQTNVQKHIPGISFQMFNDKRTMEGRLDYNYELNYLDAAKVTKIDFAHAIKASYINSFTNNWALGIAIPFRLHNGSNGAWGDFNAKSIEIALLSYHYFGKTSLRLEPSILFFMPNSTSTVSKFTYYSFSAKANLPWKLFIVWPSIKLAPGRISRSSGGSTVHDYSLSLFRPLGLGARVELVGTAKKGYVSDNWEFITGVAMEYVY